MTMIPFKLSTVLALAMVALQVIKIPEVVNADHIEGEGFGFETDWQTGELIPFRPGHICENSSSGYEVWLDLGPDHGGTLPVYDYQMQATKAEAEAEMNSLNTGCIFDWNMCACVVHYGYLMHF